jgi:hypothetical protein
VDADDPFDLNRLALTPERAGSVGRAATAKRHRQQFVKFPRSWVGQLQDARHIGSYRIALYLLFQHWKSDGRPIRLSNIALVGMRVAGAEAASSVGIGAAWADQGRAAAVPVPSGHRSRFLRPVALTRLGDSNMHVWVTF